MNEEHEPLFVILFYKFKSMKDLDKFRREHLKFCEDLGIMGRILIANEGINGSVSGTREQIDSYKKHLTSLEGFDGIIFKEDKVLAHPFTKMQVKIKKQIINFGREVDMSKKGQYLEPNELMKWYESETPGEDFVVIDTRNDYEYKVGRFKNSVHLKLKTFREFPEKIKEIEHLKNKKIVTYCTGGIRCEKASSFMRDQGFENVYQLKDGILTYGKENPDTFWEGKCFVFDKRMFSDINSDTVPITNCEICGEISDLNRNCRNPSCDKLFISCVECEKDLNGCCSEKCYNELQKHFKEKSIKNQGRRTNNLINGLISNPQTILN